MYSFIFIVSFQLSAYLFLSRRSKLIGNREIDFLSLNKLRFWLFLMLEIFVVFWGHIVYNMLFYIMPLTCSLKLNFEPAVILSSVTVENNFAVLSPTCNIREPLFPMILNWNLSGFAFFEFCTNHSYTSYISCIRLVNVLSTPQE